MLKINIEKIENDAEQLRQLLKSPNHEVNLDLINCISEDYKVLLEFIPKTKDGLPNEALAVRFILGNLYDEEAEKIAREKNDLTKHCRCKVCQETCKICKGE